MQQVIDQHLGNSFRGVTGIVIVFMVDMKNIEQFPHFFSSTQLHLHALGVANFTESLIAQMSQFQIFRLNVHKVILTTPILKRI